jgi:hypothetical protein
MVMFRGCPRLSTPWPYARGAGPSLLANLRTCHFGLIHAAQSLTHPSVISTDTRHSPIPHVIQLNTRHSPIPSSFINTPRHSEAQPKNPFLTKGTLRNSEAAEDNTDPSLRSGRRKREMVEDEKGGWWKTKKGDGGRRKRELVEVFSPPQCHPQGTLRINTIAFVSCQ